MWPGISPCLGMAEMAYLELWLHFAAANAKAEQRRTRLDKLARCMAALLTSGAA